MAKSGKWKSLPKEPGLALDDYFSLHKDDNGDLYASIVVPVSAGRTDDVAWILAAAVDEVLDVVEVETLMPRHLMYAKMLAVRTMMDAQVKIKREQASNR